MRSVEIPDWHLMGHEMAAAIIRKPAVQMEGWRLDPERRLSQMREVEVNRGVWRGTDRAGDAGEHRYDRSMKMARCDQPHARMPSYDAGKLGGIAQILAIHVPDPGDERRVVQEQQRRTAFGR